LGIRRLFPDQNGHAPALGFTIPTRHIQDIGVSKRTGFRQDHRQANGIKEIVEIVEEADAHISRKGETENEETKTQAIGQEEKAEQQQKIQKRSPPKIASR
ncbi:hypothetical protein, partial [Klebsiella pneumoniae]|uniref:hypothetical protein n=1 Tax=Klebsiella pneumoniae TaxID=573 RepID=UPI003B5C3EE9